MTPTDRTERRLSRVSQIAHGPLADEDEQFLHSALSDRSGAVVARAARLVASRELEQFAPAMAEHLEELLDSPPSRDKGCLAAEALVNALAELGHEGPEVYLKAARHVQMEPVYGGRQDTAGELRAAAASALFRTGYRDILFVIVRMLTDGEPSPRQAAVDALGKLGSESCELLLRMKVLTGDPDESLIASCFSALMQLAPRRSFDFVARFLESGDDAIVQGAALALGESRADGAFAALKAAWDARVGDPVRRELLLPMALTRADAAWEFLVPVLRDGPAERAAEALQALKLFDDWGARRDHLRKLVLARDDDRVRQAWFTEFGEELEG